VDESNVRVQRWHHGYGAFAIGTIYELDFVVYFGKVAAKVATQGKERQFAGAGRVAPHHAEVGILLNLQRLGDALLDGAADTVQAAHAGIAEVAEDEPSRNPGCHHLVIHQVWRHAREGQVLFALANNLMRGRKTDEGGKAFNRDTPSVVYEAAYRLRHGDNLVGVHREEKTERLEIRD
jgi:hypothetical protein